MTTIHFVDGEKGGTGKSWFSRLLHHLMLERHTPFMGIEADPANPTYHNVYPDTQLVPFSIHPNEMDLADVLYEMALEMDLIVSLPAQAHRAVSNWLVTKGVAALAKRNNIVIKKWWISDGEDDSLNLFARSATEMGDQIQHIFVKNLGRCSDWTYFNNHLATQQAIRTYKVPVIELPEMSSYRRIQVNAKRLSFAAAIQDEDLGAIGRMVVEQYLMLVELPIVAGGAFGEPSAEAMAIAHSDLGVAPAVDSDDSDDSADPLVDSVDSADLPVDPPVDVDPVDPPVDPPVDADPPVKPSKRSTGKPKSPPKPAASV